MPPVSASKYMVQAGWEHVPHLDAKTQAELLASTPPHMRDARSKGSPSLGAGAIYPVEQSAFIVAPFAIPPHYAKGYGLDVGWNTTAAIFGAHDRDADVLYLYSEHYRGMAEPSVHADAIKARGKWLQGAIDPAANGRSQKDGEQLIENYRALELNLSNADNAVEAGILEVWQMLSSGRLKVFSSMSNWLAEHRLYRRDENGRIVKKLDHAMDATRYLVRTRGTIMKTAPVVGANKIPVFAVADKRGGY